VEKFEQIIIGAGAAGLFAAAHSKLKTLVLEKKSEAGNKLLISGQGRCNFTHSGQISLFFAHYGNNSTFIKQVLKKYTNQQLIQFLENQGLKIFEDKNGKLFPESGNASDILDILTCNCHKNNHKFLYNQAVLDISYVDGLYKITTKTDSFLGKKVLIATGGKSYPSTGSTGDGYELAEKFGHTIIEPKPALSPVYIKNYQFREIAGVSLNNCQINLYRKDKKLAKHFGHMVFTHNGLSGPGILDFSRYMESLDILKLNICGISIEELNSMFLEEVKNNGKSTIQTFLRQFEIPKALLRILLEQVKIEPAEKIGNLNKEQRKQLIEKFCECPFEIEKIAGFNVAMCTTGGVSVNEINPKTMESKLQPGLFFAGEVIDIDGDTGGYNLQAAFSTGYIAAGN
jgi:predicted Rossmann fold flavoprotein